MFMIKTSLLALAASAGMSAVHSAPPSTIPMTTLGNNNNESMSTTSGPLPLHSEPSTVSPFMKKLLGQKQEKPIMTKEEMIEEAIENLAHHQNHEHKSSLDWSKLSQAEILRIVETANQRHTLTDGHELVHQVDKGRALQEKLGTFVMCETSPDVPVQSLTLQYTLKGYKHTRHVMCEKGQMKTLQVPKTATDVTVDCGEGERGLSVDRKPYQSSVWRSSVSRDVEVVREIFDVLSRLEAAGDYKGLSLVSQDILKGIPKGDPNGIHMRASRAQSAAKEWLQNNEDLASAQDWFNVTKAAKARARSEL